MKSLFLFFVLFMLMVWVASAEVFTTSVNLSVFNKTINISTESGSSVFSCDSDSNNSREISLSRDVQSSSADYRGVLEGLANLRSDLTSRENYFSQYLSIYPQVAKLNASLEVCKSQKDYKPDFDSSQSQLAALVTRHNQLQIDSNTLDNNWKTCETKRKESVQGTLSGIGVGAVGGAIAVWALTRKKSVEERVGRS